MNEIPRIRNLFREIPDSIPEELTEVLAAGQNFRLERIVSAGHSSPEDFWYDQAEDEWVIVLKGEGRLEFEQSQIKDSTPVVTLKAGDAILIPAHCRHRVDFTSTHEETIWLALFFER